MLIFAVRALEELLSLILLTDQHQWTSLLAGPRSQNRDLIIFRRAIHHPRQTHSKPPVPIPPLSRSLFHPFPDRPPSNSLHISHSPFDLTVPSILPPFRPGRFLHPIRPDTLSQPPTVVGICYRCEFARKFGVTERIEEKCLLVQEGGLMGAGALVVEER